MVASLVVEVLLPDRVTIGPGFVAAGRLRLRDELVKVLPDLFEDIAVLVVLPSGFLWTKIKEI